MEFKFTAGGTFDMLTPQEMGEFVDKLDKTMKGMHGDLSSSLQRPSVKRFTAVVNNITAATGTFFGRINDGPHRGMSWDIRRIAVTGQDSSAIVAGASGAIFRNQPNQPLSLVDIIATIPWKENYSAEEFTLEAEEDFVVVIFNMPTGAVNGNPMFVNGQATEYIRTDIAAQVVIS